MATPTITENARVKPPETASQITAKKEPEVSEIVKVQNEIDTAFSPFMDDLESIQRQNPKEPFFVKVGTTKGGKLPEGSYRSAYPSPNDSRVILLIAPDNEGSFTIITRQGPKKIKPDSEKVSSAPNSSNAKSSSLQAIIDRYSKDNKSDGFRGGFVPYGENKTNSVTIGYSYENSDHARVDYDVSTLSTPSIEEVQASIQRSRELAHIKEEERQKPLRDTLEQAKKSKEMASQLSEFLKKPFVLPTETGPATPPPPSAPTI